MLFFKAKRELEILKAFQKVFWDDEGKLTKEGKIVLGLFRDEAGARGELGKNGVPYFYDNDNRFDANAAAFLLGKRRMFDLMIKYLSLDERDVFKLIDEEKKKEDDLLEELNV